MYRRNCAWIVILYYIFTFLLLLIRTSVLRFALIELPHRRTNFQTQTNVFFLNLSQAKVCYNLRCDDCYRLLSLIFQYIMTFNLIRCFGFFLDIFFFLYLVTVTVYSNRYIPCVCIGTYVSTSRITHSCFVMKMNSRYQWNRIVYLLTITRSIHWTCSVFRTQKNAI